MADQKTPSAGSVCWTELNTHNPPHAREFYTKLFGWTTGEMDMGSYKYTILEHDGRGFGGMFPMEDPKFKNVPPHWMVYFAVDDIDAAVAKVVELGGKVHMPKTEIPVGWFAIVVDPEGAAFSLFKYKSM